MVLPKYITDNDVIAIDSQNISFLGYEDVKESDIFYDGEYHNIPYMIKCSINGIEFRGCVLFKSSIIPEILYDGMLYESENPHDIDMINKNRRSVYSKYEISYAGVMVLKQFVDDEKYNKLLNLYAVIKLKNKILFSV